MKATPTLTSYIAVVLARKARIVSEALLCHPELKLLETAYEGAKLAEGLKGEL